MMNNCSKINNAQLKGKKYIVKDIPSKQQLEEICPVILNINYYFPFNKTTSCGYLRYFLVENNFHQTCWVSLVAQMVKNPPAMLETWVRFLGWEDPLEKGMATHSSILAWRISWTYNPGGRKESDMTERL